MGKSYILSLNPQHERKHEETSASDPDHNYFRSGNSVTSSAETPTLENSESREPANQSFSMLPQLRIKLGPSQTEQEQNDDFELPKIRIKLNLSDEANIAQLQEENIPADSTNAPDLLEILQGLDKSKQKTEKDQTNTQKQFFRVSGTLQAVD